MRRENILFSVRGIKINSHSGKNFMRKRHHPEDRCVKKQCTTTLKMTYSYLKNVLQLLKTTKETIGLSQEKGMNRQI